MCILPSGAKDSKRLKYTIFCPEYQAECTSLFVLLHEFHNGIVEELRVICQRFPSGFLIHPDLVFHHILGIFQREGILIAVIHVVVDAYDHFAEGESPDPPFICFLYPKAENFGADNLVYHHFNRLDIEVYTDYKDPDMEATIEEVLTAHELYYEKSEVWIETEKMYEVLYELTV